MRFVRLCTRWIGVIKARANFKNLQTIHKKIPIFQIFEAFKVFASVQLFQIKIDTSKSVCQGSSRINFVVVHMILRVFTSQHLCLHVMFFRTFIVFKNTKKKTFYFNKCTTFVINLCCPQVLCVQSTHKLIKCLNDL